MKITKIEKQKRNENRYSVYIDEDFAFGIDGVDLLANKLQEGRELTSAEYNYIIEEVLFAKARDKAVRFLEYRARSRKELFDKLKDPEDAPPDEIVERVIALMERYGYINDYQFACNYISEKTRLNGAGRKRISYELKLKGIEDQAIQEAYESLEVDEVATARAALDKRYRNMDFNDLKEKKRAYDFLLRKGFDYDTAKMAMEQSADRQADYN